jgi:hypothetical protein
MRFDFRAISKNPFFGSSAGQFAPEYPHTIWDMRHRNTVEYKSLCEISTVFFQKIGDFVPSMK